MSSESVLAITLAIRQGENTSLSFWGSSDSVRYIHANYRFIVKPYGDYKPQAINADQHLDWDDVLQILASAESQDASCPICLSHPVAPRMAKCGHIFCLPCLIRYMHSTDGDSDITPQKKARWQKCPICWDSFYISETKPVRWYLGQEGPAPREGEDVVLRLVMRQPGTTLALPRDGAEALGKLDDIPWFFAAEVTDYARIMKGSEEYMLQQFDGEIEAIKLQEDEDELMFNEEPEWTKKAVNAVHEAKERVKGIGDPPTAPVQPRSKRPPIKFQADDSAPEMYLMQHASKAGVSTGGQTQSLPQQIQHGSPVPIAGSKKNTARPGCSSTSEGHHPDDPYFFYQSLLHYYLAPLDIRILKAAFGDFASFPSTLLPRIERISRHVMDDTMRKRTKYLAHLPYGCEVGFLECNWTDVVVPEILDLFKEEIEKRRKRNHDKEVREERDRVRAEKAEDEARWAGARRSTTNYSEEVFSADDFNIPLSSLDAANASPPWPLRQGSSFASLASPSNSPPGPRTVWGTTLGAPASPDVHAQQAEQDGDDGWLHSWEDQLLDDDELLARVQAASLNEGPSNAPPAQGTQGKKKKGKKQKITLMSTTARRAA